ncbi:MAG: tRNA/rRNA methyltransferase SpoU [Candidatus Berkelbacteria bacterium Licking1014_7]|uniref:tRNA/rRNA methyltransferase SpoU n=1 Tax=Candidatus Berkelbacteria bacterium Licking1014_7 TaxID=2017147 RepID=A0A554LJF0_9BACT|nr:MAG: tRNA/rRNA methyltransferase SpoU [Candidatus Berkelbacteria bacterium Licking1014_7]
MYYTYILNCSDNSYYVGSTDNLKNRIKRHNQKDAADFTAQRRPCQPVWIKQYPTRGEAMAQEKKTKKFSRANKEKLIFYKGTIWQHYKGKKYIILDRVDNLVIYAGLNEWRMFLTRQKIAGEQLGIWARHQNQWLDWIKYKERKNLRFSVIYSY